MNNPIEIFFSYAHEDEGLMNDVRRQLIVEERNGRILKWHDRKIPAGTDWRQQIDSHLEHADIILLFMSPHFIESQYCYEVEGRKALSRHISGKARVIPVILRPCLWQRSPFSGLQALPKDGKPISRWADKDEVCLEVARGVLIVVDQLIASQETAQEKTRVLDEAIHTQTTYSNANFEKIERLLPKLLQEMRKDLLENPTGREFVILKKGSIYNHQGDYLAYLTDEHDGLEDKLQILVNLNFIREITYNNVRRFVFEEIFVDYLTRSD